MQMVSTSGVTAHAGGYTLPPTAAYFPMATYATLQQQHQHSSLVQANSSVQQSISDQSSQIQVPVAAASSASAVPISVADTATSTVSKSIDGTPTVTQPNTPDLLIHRRQVSSIFTCISLVKMTIGQRYRLQCYLTIFILRIGRKKNFAVLYFLAKGIMDRRRVIMLDSIILSL